MKLTPGRLDDALKPTIHPVRDMNCGAGSCLANEFAGGVTSSRYYFYHVRFARKLNFEMFARKLNFESR